MGMNRDRYPRDWDEISKRIRYERAGGCCEWCSAPDRAYIRRRKSNPAEWRICTQDFAGDGQWYRATRVILTVHHIGVPYPDGRPGNPHDKMDCREENLVALCNRCHLLADLSIRVAAAKRTRLRKKIEAAQNAGQLSLFE